MSEEVSKAKVKLNISERVAALNILNAFKGNMETMAVVLDDIKGFTVTEAEWEKAERKVNKDGDSVQWSWDNEKGGDVDIEVSPKTVEYLIKAIAQKSEKEELTLENAAMLALNTKLKAL